MAESPTGRDSDKFMLRFPDGMRDRLKDAAAENGRSMNAEIIQRLEASFDEKAGSPKGASQDFLDGFASGLVDSIIQNPAILDRFREGHEERVQKYARMAKKKLDKQSDTPSSD